MTSTLVDTAQIDALFSDWDKTDSPGCALAILQDGEVIYSRGYGMASLELAVPIEPDSVFHVASVSKQFCACAIALLAADGKLSLDDDVRKHVPELPDLGHTITIRHFLNHTSGMRDQYGLFRMAGWRDDDVQTNDDVIDFALRHRRLNFAPGDEYDYCNTSYTLLALIVSRVSGQSLREFTTERIFKPLGMTNSHFQDDHSEVIPGRTNAYSPRKDDGFKRNDSNVDAVGAICLFTTAEDLAKWVRNYQRKEVAGDVLDQMMTPGTLNNGESLRYGFGLMVHRYRGMQTVGHSGSDSGYRAQVLWFPEADFGVVILSNLSNFKPGYLAQQIADLYLAGQLGEDPVRNAPAIELSQDELAPYAGLYVDEHTHLSRRIEMEDGVLKADTGWGESEDLTPIGHDRFRTGTPPSPIDFQRSGDAILSLTEDAPGGFSRTYTKVEQAAPTAEQLAAYAGAFSCPDLGVTYSIVVRDGKLMQRQRKMEDHELKPGQADAFTRDGTTIIFHRDGRGDVTSFELFNERNRYLLFERVG